MQIAKIGFNRDTPQRKNFHQLPGPRMQIPRPSMKTASGQRDLKKAFFLMLPDLGIQSFHIFQKCPRSGHLKLILNRFFRPRGKCIFNIHDPPGIRKLFQLRLGLSPLRSHKLSHNFEGIVSGSCLCNTGIEDTSHFLFKCPYYASHRAALAVQVIRILTQNNLNHLGNSVHLYLYGHHSLSDNDNKSIILATIKFIKSTNRFV